MTQPDEPANLIQYSPDYDPETWSRGYQGRQFGVTDNSDMHGDVLHALADPPEEMLDAAEVVSDWNEAPPSNP
jgi:hypothetical protein